MIKPPLGLVPKEYSAEYCTRFHDVGNAINRYLLHPEYIKIPVDWVMEYNNLCDILKNHSLRTTHNSDYRQGLKPHTSTSDSRKRYV